MRNVIRLLIVVLFLQIIIINCSKDSPNEPEESADVIMPLSVGNYWKFTTKYGPSILEWEIQSNINIYGKEAYVVKMILTDSSEVTENNINLINLTDGLYYDDNGEFKLWYKYPVEVGNVNDIGDIYIKVISTNKKINVQGGNFSDCIEYGYYRKTDNTLKDVYIFKPNLGPIILEDEWELESYNLVQ